MTPACFKAWASCFIRVQQIKKTRSKLTSLSTPWKYVSVVQHFQPQELFLHFRSVSESVARADKKEAEVNHFTVSAHSLCAEKSFGLGFHKDSLWFIPFITTLAVGLNRGIFPFLLIQQYLSVRLAVSMIHICWKYVGHQLRLHSVVGISLRVLKF